MAKKKKFSERVGEFVEHAIHGDDSEIEQGEAQADNQEKYEAADAQADEPKKSKPSNPNKKDWRKDISDHPKFAKFKREGK